MIWDDHQGRCIGELTFRSQVRSPSPPCLPVTAESSALIWYPYSMRIRVALLVSIALLYAPCYLW